MVVRCEGRAVVGCECGGGGVRVMMGCEGHGESVKVVVR